MDKVDSNFLAAPELTTEPQSAVSPRHEQRVVLILGCLFLAGLVGVSGYALGKNSVPQPSSPPVVVASPTPPPDEGVACTMDAKMCPDGSAVGRTGPNCEFAECPVASSPAPINFWYPPDQFASHLRTLDQEKIYGVFKTKAAQEACSAHLAQVGTFFESRESLEIYEPCNKDMYSVKVYTQTADTLDKNLFMQPYTDQQGRKWTTQEIEVQGHYRVVGLVEVAGQNYVVTLETWMPNMTMAELKALATQTFEGFVP